MFTTSPPSEPRHSEGRFATTMRSLLGIGLLSGLIGTLSACGTASLDDHQMAEPSFAPEEFFNGILTAHGVVRDYSGAATRHFNADITACWQEGVGTLDEAFVFDDGEQQVRIWTLTPDGAKRYIGTAGDVVGEGNARWQGNAMFLDYTLRIELEDGPIDVHIDDRMYRVSENVVINESKMRKFGVGVGEILLTLVRHPEREATCPSN